jgi:perosamine synthetase
VTARIPWWAPAIGGREYELVRQVLESEYLKEGDLTREFERRLAALLGVRHVVATTSGTSAIFLALAALGIGHGDEVIVPDLTFIATANAVTLAGATPMLADIERTALTVSPCAVERAVTPRTKAIVPVHISGRAADMDAILALARRYDLHVVEDAAEALLSRNHDGAWLGTLGDAGCFSFSPNKTITTGQGGCVATNDDRLCVRLRELKDQGRAVRGTGGNDVHPATGFNFKLTNLQAAVGIGQLELLQPRLERQRAIQRGYTIGLGGVAGIRLLPFRLEHGETPQWTDALAERRDELDRFLATRGVGCRPFWYPLHTQAPYRRPDAAFPVSSEVGAQAIWLPSAFTLSDDDVAEVCRHVREFYGAPA